MKDIRDFFRKGAGARSAGKEPHTLPAIVKLSHNEFMEKIEEQKGTSKDGFSIVEAADRYLDLKMRMPLHTNAVKHYAYIYNLRDGFFLIKPNTEDGETEYHFHSSFLSALKEM